MHKLIVALIALAALLGTFVFVGSGADAAGPVTPLDEEPVSLRVDGNQQITDHAHIPAVCSITVDRVGDASCIEVISDWVCPAGVFGLNPLSEDAKARMEPEYDALIANPETPRAYLDTHCLIVGTRPMPVPTPTVACSVGQVVAFSPTAGKLVCATVHAAAAVPAVAVPVPVFTG
jgi:hypothetical protein